MNASRYQNYVAINNSNVLNTTNSGSYSLNMYLGKNLEKVFDNSIWINATYNTSTSTVQNSNATNYWNYNIRPDLDFFLPAKFQIHTDINFQFQQKNSSFGADRRWTLWNAWIGKKLMKEDALLIKISANDLLNQNIGLNRNISSNYVSQETYTTVKRFFLFSVIWSFNKNGKAPSSSFY
jgi:hypothetical protein